MKVRPETPDDTREIYDLLAACFPTQDEARLVNSLRESGRLLLSLVAESDGRIVGHLAFSPVNTASGATGVGLAPVSVAESHRRQGIATTLIRDGMSRCRTAGYGWAVVLGEPNYYGRFGFRPAATCGLSDEYGGGEAFQVCELVPSAIPLGAGLVRYASDFEALGG